mmetsp:Transcript_6336/g.10369  ORF Transcript_6336/g.10369 Transcript_6336/m.10369 type:complete len:288 (-) Transcript_6336:811-1674(-)
MGQSDLIILAVSLLGFVLIGYFILSLTKQKERGAHLNNRDDEVLNGGEQQRQRGNLRRRRGGGGGVNDEDNVDNEEGEDEQDERGDTEPDLAGMTKKEIAKIEKRRAKAQQREAMEAEREERKEREEARMQMLREREQEKEEEFQLREAERLRELAAKEKERQLAYNHWKDPYPDHVITFPVAANVGKKVLPWDKSVEEAAGVKEKVMVCVKSAKVVTLTELSMRVQIPTFNCIKILKHLVNTREICGVFIDDEQFAVVDDTTASKVISLANEKGVLSMKDILDVVQ